MDPHPRPPRPRPPPRPAARSSSAQVTKTRNTVQEEDATLSELLKEAIKDIPDSMDENELEWENVPDLAREIEEFFRNLVEQANLNSIPAAPNITRNHSNSQEAGESYGYTGGPTAETQYPYTHHLSNTVLRAGQPTVASAFQPAQTSLPPQASQPYTSQYVPVNGTTFSFGTLPQRPMPQQPYHCSSQNPQHTPNPQTTQQPSPQWDMSRQGLAISQSNTTWALYQGAQSMQNRYISQNAQINQNISIARSPQMAQEFRARGRIPQRDQSHQGGGAEFGNGPQQLGGSHSNRNPQQYHGFQQRIGPVQRGLAQRAPGCQASQWGQDPNQSNGLQQGNDLQSKAEHP